MSADRYEINMDELGCWARQSNEAWACVMRFTQDSDSLQERIAEKVIRQQARDRDQLRGELAAAVEEREKIRTMYIEAIERFCDDLQALRERAEQAEARLTAIDGAPTVAIAVHTHTDRGPYKHLSYSELNVPRDGVELIARTAKD